MVARGWGREEWGVNVREGSLWGCKNVLELGSGDGEILKNTESYELKWSRWWIFHGKWEVNATK